MIVVVVNYYFSACIQKRYLNESDGLPGCIVGGENINNLRYADDTVRLAESESALQGILNV